MNTFLLRQTYVFLVCARMLPRPVLFQIFINDILCITTAASETVFVQQALGALLLLNNISCELTLN